MSWQLDDLNSLVDMFPKDFESYPSIPAGLCDKIRAGIEVGDDEFDKILPRFYRIKSTVHWSSIQVARQIAEWINPLKATKFIDIGCGVGKLCLLLRILTKYEIQIIRASEFKNISIKQLNMLDLDWDDYDIYYLYNPFQEHITTGDVCVLERDIELDQKHYTQYTTEVFRQLSCASSGKVLITFHGYGGEVPSSWKIVASKPIKNGTLKMWVKK
jgi:hypothetical protein